MIQEIIKKYQLAESIAHDSASISYTWIVRRFFSYVQKGIEDITLDDIISYQSSLKKRNKQSTQATSANALRSFFRFTSGRGLTNIDPLQIKVTRVEEVVPVYVIQEEFEALCRVAQYQHPIRLLAIRLLWFTGVRVSELCSMRLDQIDLQEKCAKVQTKKSFKPKQIFWDDDTNDLMSGIIRNDPEREYLFMTQYGRTSTRQIERWIKLMVRKAGIKKHITPHAFRHGATKEWLNNGVDLPAIKDLLGHKNLISIEKYTKRLDEDIKEKGREAVRQRVMTLKYKIENLVSVDNFQNSNK